MPYVLVHSQVEDYNKWKIAFKGNESLRKNGGSKGERIFQSKDNSNDLVILFEWDNIDNARKFTNSPELRERMKEAGVTGRPEIIFLDEIKI